MYPDVIFYMVDGKTHKLLDAPLVISFYLRNDYVLLIRSDEIVHKPLRLRVCIDALEETGAYAFYFKHNVQEAMQVYQTMPLIKLHNDMYAWNFAVAFDEWATANSLDFVLHRKENIAFAQWRNSHRQTTGGIEYIWAIEGSLDNVGLCFGERFVG